MKRHPALLVCALLLQGCAALMNSNRPSYEGPIARPLWHNASVLVEQPPLLYDGLVYALGRPSTGRPYNRVYAFDLHTGHVRWSADFSAKCILLPVGGTLYVADIVSRVHSLNAKTGQEFAPPDAISFSAAKFADGFLYSVGGAILSAWAQDALPVGPRPVGRQPKPLWTASPAVETLMAPVAAGGQVYAYGFTHSDFLTRKRGLHGIYAYDRSSGEARWKWELADKTDAFLIHGVAADPSSVYAWMSDKSRSLFGAGVLLVLDAATGLEKWRHTTRMFVAFPATPLLLESGEVVIADFPDGKDPVADPSGWEYRALDRATGQTRWASRTAWKYRNLASDGRMLVASDQRVHEVFNENNTHSPDSWVSAVDLKTGQERWRSETVELGVFTTPAIGEGMVVVGSKPYSWSSPPREGKPEVAGLWAWSLDRR